MSFASSLRRTLLVSLAWLALCAPAALARPADLRSEMQGSALSGTMAPYTLEHRFDTYPETASPREAALAQERAYSTYGAIEPVATAPAVVADTGIAPVPFALAVLGALVVGIGAGSALHVAVARRRHAAGLAT